MSDPGPIDSRVPGWAPATSTLAFTIAIALALCFTGASEQAEGVAAALAWAFNSLYAAPIALAAIASAWGLGRIPAFVAARFGAGLDSYEQAACGVALTMVLAVGLGALGLLNAVVTWAVFAMGFVLLLDQLARGPLKPESWPRPPMLICAAAPALAILSLASATAPGWLWSSEFGGYDVLSYHLQLPREWIETGRVWPVDHNVYSFLPSGVEAWFAFLGAPFGPTGPDDGSLSRALAPVGGHGVWALASQYLHACLGVLAAVLTARAAQRVLGVEARARSTLIGVVLLSAPWTLVTASMAYNEMAAAACVAGGLLVAMRDRHNTATWAIVALLLGGAALAKPTALVLGGPAVAAVMIARGGWRWSGFGVGVIVGLVTLAPWLARNWVASGSPVFPLLSDAFGGDHWNAEQAARFAAAHQFDGSLLERARTALFTSRGMFAAQWSGLFALGLLGAVVGSLAGTSRRTSTALVLGAGAGLLGWFSLTHVQSRFLVPLSPVLAVGLALGLHAMATLLRRGAGPDTTGPRVALGVATAAAITAIASGLWTYSAQLGGAPARGLDLGAEVYTGEHWESNLAGATEEARSELLEFVGPAAWVNLSLETSDTVLLVGGATPMYIRRPVLYSTTWDTGPLAAVLPGPPADPDNERIARGDAEAWTRALIERFGVDIVLVDFDELTRLGDDGWLDPRMTRRRIEAWTGALGPPEMVWQAPDGRVTRAAFRLTRGGGRP